MEEKNEQDVDLNNEEEVVEDKVESTEETEEKTEEETTEETKEEEKVEKPKESLEDRKARLTRQLGQTNKKLGIDTTKKPVTKTISGNLSQSDFIYLAKADIHEDDMDEVTNYASKNDVSMKEAHEYLKPILAVNAEQRNTASAANVGDSKRGTGKIPDDVLLANARKGELPDNDVDLERLIKKMKGIK